jgi:asparagine synthase (glutamine-hydrolysing)
MRGVIAVFNKRGRNAFPKAVSMLTLLKHKGADAFGIATPNKTVVDAALEKLSKQELKSPTVVGHVFVKVTSKDKPQPVPVGKAALVFDGRIYHPHVEPPETDFAIKTLRESGSEAGAEELIRGFDGCFAFAIAEDGKLVVGRDTLGLYPLYYGENTGFFAFASECKALWKIGIKRAKSFQPGALAVVDRRGFKIKPVKALKRQTVAPSMSMDEAADELVTLLEKSVKERTSGLGEIAVAFSGGIDSSLIAWLAKKAGVKVHLIHVSLEKQPETEQAEKASGLLDLPFLKYLYSDEDLQHVLPKVLWATENPNPIAVSIGVPIFWTAEKTAELGLKVLFAGQGADECFGGYKRYQSIYARFGEEAAEKALVHDVLTVYKTNFERDSKICAFNNLELRLPFASHALMEFALGLPLKMKIESPSDPLRKAVLRKAAKKIGMPPQIVNRPKKAVQYATGVAKAIKRLAKKDRVTVKQFLQKLFSEIFKDF